MYICMHACEMKVYACMHACMHVCMCLQEGSTKQDSGLVGSGECVSLSIYMYVHKFEAR